MQESTEIVILHTESVENWTAQYMYTVVPNLSMSILLPPSREFALADVTHRMTPQACTSDQELQGYGWDFQVPSPGLNLPVASVRVGCFL